jgi:hypothetical protein
MIVKRCFFPSRGRIQRRINTRKERGQIFAGSVWSFWWGPFCAFLVFDETSTAAPVQADEVRAEAAAL